MKHIYKLFLSLTLAVTCCITACKEPTDGVNLSIDADVSKYSVFVKVNDAADLSTQIPNLKMTVTGSAANDVFESGGSRDYKFGDGRITLILHPSKEISNSAPAKFNIQLTADGYLPVNLPVTIDPEQFQQTLEVPMVNKTALPAGVSSKTQSFTLSGNAISSNSSIETPTSTPPAGDKSESAIVSIPAGTKFYKKDGSQITGGSINAEVIHFDSKSVEGLNNFPGTFMVEGAKLPNGGTGNINFVTAGFASVDMKIGNEEVKKFDKEVTITIGIDPEFINPATGQKVQAGDQLPAWSYEVTTGLWQFEENATVVDNGGKLTASFTTDHLTWFNIAYNYSVCDAPARFNLNTNGYSGTFYVELYTQNQVNPFYSTSMYMYNGLEFGFTKFPSAPVKAVIYQESYRWATYSYRVRSGWFGYRTVSYSYLQTFRDKIAETSYTSYCGKVGTLTPINFFGAAPAQKFTFDFVGKCSSKGNVEIKPSLYIEYQEEGAPSWDWRDLGYMYRGHLETTQLKVGKTYNFRAWYGKDWVKVTRKVEKTNYKETVTLPGSICGNL